MHENDALQSEAVRKFVSDPFYTGAVLLAGDTAPGPAAPCSARSLWPRAERIIMIPGNHEHCMSKWFDTVGMMMRSGKAYGVEVLHDNMTELVQNDYTIRILGSVLWTDYGIFNTPELSMALMDAHFTEIGRRNTSVTRMSSRECLSMHIKSRAWLNRMLDTAHNGPTIVMTHHLPSARSIHPQFAQSPSTAVFASHADELTTRCSLYLHGHTHCGMLWKNGSVTVFCNPSGRWRGSINNGYWENPDFRPNAEVEFSLSSGEWKADIY